MVNKTKIILFAFISYLLIGLSNPLISQSTVNHSSKKSVPTIFQKGFTVTILGDKKGRNTSLKEFEGSWFGLNLAYLKNINEPEKAILGLISTYAGTECEPSSTQTNEYTGLFNCKLTKALGLGDQCSETYLNLLHKWFRNDTVIMKELKNCGAFPSGASNRISFGKITLTRYSHSIKIYFLKEGASSRTSKTWESSETLLFKVDKDQIRLVRRSISKTHST